jgi:predicted nucleotide-binding protein
MRLVAYGHRITARRRLPNNLGWQVRLAAGQVVTIFDTGSLLVQGVNREPVKQLLQHFSAAPGAGAQHNAAPAHISTEPPKPAKRSPGQSARLDPARSYIGANGRPIPLPGTDAA